MIGIQDEPVIGKRPEESLSCLCN